MYNKPHKSNAKHYRQRPYARVPVISTGRQPSAQHPVARQPGTEHPSPWHRAHTKPRRRLELSSNHPTNILFKEQRYLYFVYVIHICDLLMFPWFCRGNTFIRDYTRNFGIVRLGGGHSGYGGVTWRRMHLFVVAVKTVISG